MKKLKDEQLKNVNGGCASCGGAIYNTDNADITIKNCENIAIENDKPSSGGYVGGICGDTSTNYTIENCYNVAKPDMNNAGAGIGGGKK